MFPEQPLQAHNVKPIVNFSKAKVFSHSCFIFLNATCNNKSRLCACPRSLIIDCLFQLLIVTNDKGQKGWLSEFSFFIVREVVIKFQVSVCTLPSSAPLSTQTAKILVRLHGYSDLPWAEEVTCPSFQALPLRLSLEVN